MLILALVVLGALLIGLRVGWRNGYEYGRWDVYRRLPKDVQDDVDDSYLVKYTVIHHEA